MTTVSIDQGLANIFLRSQVINIPIFEGYIYIVACSSFLFICVYYNPLKNVKPILTVGTYGHMLWAGPWAIVY